MAKLSVKKFQSSEEARNHFLGKVDHLAEQARSKIITSAPGQVMTYDAKYQEAKRYPNDGPFPWLEGEAEELNMTPQEVADSILAARSEWEAAGIAIERRRLKAKALIRGAETAPEMHDALVDFSAT